MRTAVALTLSLIAAPAVAAPPQVDAEKAARALQDPLTQEVASGVIEQLVGIVLDTRVGPTAALADPRARPDETLRDLARRDDPDFDRHLHRDTRRAVGTAAAVAGAGVTQAVELKRTAARLQAALGPLIAALGTEARY